MTVGPAAVEPGRGSEHDHDGACGGTTAGRADRQVVAAVAVEVAGGQGGPEGLAGHGIAGDGTASADGQRAVGTDAAG